MEKSKLPVLRHQAQNTAGPFVPCPKKPCPQKPVMPVYSKDPNIAFSSTVPEFKACVNGVTRKKPVASKKSLPPAYGPLTRHRMESELKDKNQLLEAANASLHSNLLSTQSKIKEMSEKQDVLEDELKEVKQHWKKSLIILESQNIDPVSGEQILSREEERNKLREERKATTEDLMREMKLVTSTTKEQTKLLQAIKGTLKESEESRKEFLKDKEAFQKDLDQFRAVLDETEKWLDL